MNTANTYRPTARRPRPRAGSELPILITIDDVAEYLGVSVRHVRRLVFERRIPYVKWGHLLRFDIDDINAWLADLRVPAVDDSSAGDRR
jgi:excisionase family DNA binding protein